MLRVACGILRTILNGWSCFLFDRLDTIPLTEARLDSEEFRRLSLPTFLAFILYTDGMSQGRDVSGMGLRGMVAAGATK